MVLELVQVACIGTFDELAIIMLLTMREIINVALREHDDERG